MAEDKSQKQKDEEKKPLSDLDFSSFLLSMHVQTLVNLGEIQSPLTGEKRADLIAAKQGIDIIMMLQEKTKGNLTESENTLLDKILYDLRIKYVEKSSTSKS